MKLLKLQATLAITISLFALGCGGGGGTGAGTVVPPATDTFSASIPLTNGSIASLAVTITGATATGTLTNAAARGRGPLDLPVGTFPVSGTFSSTAGYSLSGTLPGDKPFTITGMPPTGTTSGTYEIQSGEDSIEGGILPEDSPKPTLTVEKPILSFEPGQNGGINTEHANFPTTGRIEYRWFIAAPTATFRPVGATSPSGPDITLPDGRAIVQTTVNDSGKLKAYTHAIHVADNGLRTFLAEAVTSVELIDIDFVAANWVHELGVNPKGGQETHAYLWDFPIVTGANRYIVDFLNKDTGNVTMRYQILSSQLDQTPATEVPIYVGALPHSFPPTIPVSELLSGVVRMNFIRRGNSIRVLIVMTDPGSEVTYRANNPITVKVYK